MKKNHLYTLIASAAILLSASLASADDTLIVTLPGQTFTSGTGNTGTASTATVGTAFVIKLEAVTAGGTTVDTNFTGAKTVSYTGPTGGTTYTTAVTFASGLSTTTVNTTLVDAQTTTISASATGALTPVASSSLQVNPKLVVTLPGQTFTSGTGNGGIVSGQTAGVPFNISLTAINSDNTIDTAFTGAQTVAYSGPANAPNATTPTYTTAATFTSGQATGLATTLVDEQTTAITPAITGLVTGVASSSVTVAAGTATQLVFTTQPNGGQAGAAWTIQPVVTVEDADGNAVLGLSQSVTLAIQNNAVPGTLSGSTTVAVNTGTGLATFSGLSINNTGQGYTLTATGNTVDTSAGTVISAPFNIVVFTAYDSLILSDGARDYWPLQETVGPTFFDIGPGADNGTMYTSTDAGSAVPNGGLDAHSAFIEAGVNSTDGGTYSLGGPGGLTGFPGDKAVYFTNLVGALSNSDICTTYTTNYDTTNFTAEAWINLPTYPIGYTNQYYQVPLGLEDNAGTDAGWYIGVYADREGAMGSTAEGNVFFNECKNTFNGFNAAIAPTTPGGQWVYVVEGYDGANFFAYTNGVLLSSTAQTYGSEQAYHNHVPANTRQAPLIIGSFMVTYFGNAGSVQATGFERNAFWHGGISHVAVYPFALTAGQVLTHYNEAINPAPTPPIIALQPIGLTNYVGYSPSLTASFAGPGIHYQWYQNLNPLSGQTNQTLALNNLVASNAGTYYLNATNGGGASNSANAVVVVNPLPADPYQSNVISMLPEAFYPMHEAGPAVSGVTPCVDLISYDGVQDGAVYVAADNVTVPTLGVAGTGGSTDIGTGVTLSGGIPNGAVVTNANAMDITGNSTMEVWIQVSDYADAQNIIMHGPSIEPNPNKVSDYLGFDGFGDYYVGRYQQVSVSNYYYAFYGATTPTTPTPTAPASDVGQWVHLVGTSDGVAWHLYRNAQEVANLPDTLGALSANGGWAFGARNNMTTPPNNVIFPDCYPGAAPNFTTNGTGLTGTINNVALYNYALSPGKILAHYQIGLTGHTSPVTNTLTVTPSGSNVTLTWSYGTLQESTSVRGPWTDDLAVSPYTVGETNTQTFYRAVIKY